MIRWTLIVSHVDAGSAFEQAEHKVYRREAAYLSGIRFGNGYQEVLRIAGSDSGYGCVVFGL